MLDTIIQVTLFQLLTSTALLITIVGGLQWVLAQWIKIRLEQSIKTEYAKQIEEYKFLISKREKIANIASFFARWIKYRGYEEKWIDKKDLADYYEELTKMSFELVLWIDDEEFLKNVMLRFRNDSNATDTLDLLLKAKELVSGSKNKALKGSDITLWPSDPSILSKGPSSSE
jgi:hypothetical protein